MLDYKKLMIEMQLRAHQDGLKPAVIMVNPEYNLGNLLMGIPSNIDSINGMKVMKIKPKPNQDFAVALTDNERPSSYVIASDLNGNLSTFWYQW